ncbi:hypothetical protein EVA_14654 [gut metagenome]|uniref:Uncharacterized protein n=1 Tax=gut metagenome TaxID=749906 RepID=J9FRW5_9ZZZZ
MDKQSTNVNAHTLQQSLGCLQCLNNNKGGFPYGFTRHTQRNRQASPHGYRGLQSNQKISVLIYPFTVSTNNTLPVHVLPSHTSCYLRNSRQ